MKKMHLPALTILLLFIAAFITGCLKDECSNTYTMYLPQYQTLTQVRNNMKSGAPKPLKETGKLFTYGSYIFLNEVNKGIHVIDNTNPSQPKNLSFISIPGNVDMAIKDNYLYADAYSDLVVFDINTITNITPRKFVNHVFPDRQNYYWGTSTNPDSVQVVVGFTAKDTTVDCETYTAWSQCSNCNFIQADSRSFYTAAAAKSATVGQGGSMARFCIVNNFLYTVTSYQLFSFNITNPIEPQQVAKTNITFGIETIFPFKDKLFIGSTTGMFIYDVTTPGSPLLQGQFSHVRSCDPVIADDNHAFVTLRSGNDCQGSINRLEVLNIAKLSQPLMVKTYNLTNPHGLSKDDNLLFICDGKGGLKIYDAANVSSLQLVKTFSNIETYDVIASGGIALVVAKEGLLQFDYTDRNNIHQVSKLPIIK